MKMELNYLFWEKHMVSYHIIFGMVGVGLCDKLFGGLGLGGTVHYLSISPRHEELERRGQNFV